MVFLAPFGCIVVGDGFAFSIAFVLHARGFNAFVDEVVGHGFGACCGELVAIGVGWNAVGMATDFDDDFGVLFEEVIDVFEYGDGFRREVGGVGEEVEVFDAQGFAFFEFGSV